MPCFDTYLMVDWSARNRPATGADSVWYCLLTRNNGSLSVSGLENPATRNQAAQDVKEILRDMVRRGRRTLVGFDFPYGFPAGFAGALGVKDKPVWLGIWREIAGRLVDRDDNRNNRFEVAADFNRRISGGGYPFWGCPSDRACSTLFTTRTARGPMAEQRITDVGNMQPVWKLFGNGSVGSQALVGIPHVLALRTDPALAPVSRVWPFETGLHALSATPNPKWLILHAEIYPSILPAQRTAGEVKDSAQVRGLASHFAALDEVGDLVDLFAGSAAITEAEREIVEHEEGWALGTTQRRKLRTQWNDLQPAVSCEPRRVALPSGRGQGRITTTPGYENRNRQIVIRSTGLAGTDHAQYVYVLRCGDCGCEYGANGSDIFQRRCPGCQSGRPGLRF